MLPRCCTVTLLLLVVSCVQCLNGTYDDCLESGCEFYTDENGERYKTRVTLKFDDDEDLSSLRGFTSHTVNAEGTVVSRVNLTFLYVKYFYKWIRRQFLSAQRTRITRIPFEKDFWLANLTFVSRLSVHVYNMSLKQITVSNLQGYNLEELQLSGNSWATTSGLTLKLRGLKKLSLPDNQIEELHEGLLDGYPYLEVLDLSRNKIKRLQDVFSILPYKVTIKELNLAKNIINNINSLKWALYDNLKKVNLSYNQIWSVAPKFIPPNSEVDLSFNNITEFRDHRYYFRVDRAVLAGQNISSLSEVGTILSNTDSELLFEYSISNVELVYGNFISVHALFVLYVDNKYVYSKDNGSRICPSQESSIVNLRGNPFKIGESLVYKIRVEKHTDLAQNHLKVLSEDVPWQIAKTVHLNLSRNSIRCISKHFFKNMTRLSVLDLSYNHLKHVEIVLYSSLFTLDISNNYLNRTNISHNSSQYTTKNLNLSHNSFTNILKVDWSQFEQFSKVDLGENNLQCCGPEGQFSRIMFLRHQDKILNINSTKSLSCMMPHNNKVEMTNTWLSEDHCQKSFQGWVAFGCLLLLIPLMVHLFELLDYFTHQTERDLAEHLTHLKKQGLEQDENHALECEYDAFVCHSNKDVRWVHHELIPNLQNERDGHRLCIHYRDFPLGSLIEENIEWAMNKSRKVIVVVTRAFLESYWCKMELTYAWTKMVSEGRNYIIVIELERIPDDKRPPILCYLMQSRTYLEWPEEPTDDVKQNCWRRVRDALGKSLRDRQQEQQNGSEAFQIDC